MSRGKVSRQYNSNKAADAAKEHALAQRLAPLLKMARGNEMSQPEFAVKHEIPTGTYQRWEQAQSAPRIDQIVALARIIGLSGMAKLGFDLEALVDELRGQDTKMPSATIRREDKSPETVSYVNARAALRIVFRGPPGQRDAFVQRLVELADKLELGRSKDSS